ncbi:MAG: hypothetical protein HYT15_00860 [Candidatus Magasanikbacteria bacterium]|nr:hypothetical protein [Candidatus Magasanikbacteria bacterium]
MEGLSPHSGKQREPVPMIKIPIDSGARREVAGEIGSKAEKPRADLAASGVAKEKVAEKMREQDFTAVDLALRRMVIEATSGPELSDPEVRALVAKMREKVGEFAFHDGVFLAEKQKAGEPFVDTKRKIEITTSTGKKAEFKVMLKTDTGEFKLQGDFSTTSGIYAEQLMD